MNQEEVKQEILKEKEQKSLLKRMGFTEEVIYQKHYQTSTKVIGGKTITTSERTVTTVIVAVSHRFGDIYAGASICSSTDNFSRRTGRIHARIRLLNVISKNYNHSTTEDYK